MSIYKIQFSATCQTVPGQVVYICGNISQLGNWTPQKSLRLYTDDSLYPKWNSYKTVQIRQSSKLLFKLCIIKDNSIIRWETLQGNREIMTNSNNYVQFTEGNPELIFTPMPQVLIKPPRKKTKDILNEMDSDGASSKEYWKQFMQQEQTGLFLTLTNNMRKLIESQNSQSFVEISKKTFLSIQKNKHQIAQIQETYQICPNIFFIQQNHIEQKSINNKLHWVKEQSLDNYRIHNSKDCNIFFVQGQLSHLATNIQAINKIMHRQNLIINNLKEKLKNQIPFFIVYELMEFPEVKHIKQIIKFNVSAIFIHNQNILNQVAQLLSYLGYLIKINEQNNLIVKLHHSRQLQLILMKPQHLKRQKSKQLQKQQSQQLAQDLQKLILKGEKHTAFKSFDDFQQDIKNDNLFLNFQQNKKIIIILQVVSLQKLTMKCITQLIALSSKKKIQVYIICSQKFKDIEQRFPLSDKDKIVFLNYDGYLYANSTKSIDLFNNLCMPKQKFQQNLQKIQKQIKFGIIQKIKSQNGYLFIFSKNELGKISKQVLISRIFELNEKQIFKLCWKQYKNGIQVIPFCISGQFYYQSILQNILKLTPQQPSLIINMNFKEDNRCFTICQQTLRLNQNIVCNSKIRNYQVVEQTEKGLFQFQPITNQMAQYLFQYMNEHVLAGSNIKAYHPFVFSANNKENLRRSLRPNIIFSNIQQ